MTDKKNSIWERIPLTEERIDKMREDAFPSVFERIKMAVKNIFNQEK